MYAHVNLRDFPELQWRLVLGSKLQATNLAWVKSTYLSDTTQVCVQNSPKMNTETGLDELAVSAHGVSYFHNWSETSGLHALLTNFGFLL